MTAPELSPPELSPPVEPEPSPWSFPPIGPDHDHEEVVGIGADLAAGTLLKAYRSGIFPMPIDGRGGVLNRTADQVAWWSPNPRGVLPLDRLRVTRSLRQSCRRYTVTFNTCFDDVIRGCANPGRDGGWISEAIIAAYTQLHELGWAHSLETWDSSGQLVGGLYGVGFGQLFCGESMFHRATDASKVALVALVERLTSSGAKLVDVQWQTPHLASLGVIEISRSDYLSRVRELRNGPHCASLPS